VPHLHTHVIPRGQDDPHPGEALPWTYLDDGHQPTDPLHALADDLRRLLPTATA
jgi:diadenosine tetraphosphate (Ap4A) HIT family hydrolase